MQKVAYFRFFNSLNDFFPVKQKDKVFSHQFYGVPSIKDSIEALGVPHVEIGEIKVNGEKVGFNYSVYDQMSAEVYPGNPSLKLSNPTFVVDVHLGKLAKGLRILGFDTAFDKSYTDKILLNLTINESRIVLSRSINLLKNNKIKLGYWVRSEDPEIQLAEVVRHFQLQSKLKPFRRCLECNGEIVKVPMENISDRLPAATIVYFNDFFQCTSCKKVYWKGSHYDRMLSFIEKVLKIACN